MKKEQIEKAANAYIDDFLNDHIDYTIINNEEDNYEAGRNNALYEFGADIFKAGVEWCTNSVWHDANEVPEEGRIVLAETERCGMRMLRPCADEEYRWVFKGLGVIRWAYMEDLLPNKED